MKTPASCTPRFSCDITNRGEASMMSGCAVKESVWGCFLASGLQHQTQHETMLRPQSTKHL
jgi:hypothetical protein